MTQTRLSPEQRSIFTDIYRLYENYFDMGNMPGEWSVFWTELKELVEKHNRDPLAVDLAFSIAHYLEKERRGTLEHY